MTITKAEIRVLERIFAAEIDGMPGQPRPSKALTKIIKWGGCEPVEHMLPGRFPVIIRGYALTHAGRYAYGKWASEQPEIDEP